MTEDSSPYLSLRQAVRPAILAHFLLAEDRERAQQLASECEDLLFLTRELVKAIGLTNITGAPAAADSVVSVVSAVGDVSDVVSVVSAVGDSDRQAQLLGAYAEAGLLWAKVVGSTMALARTLLDRGDWAEVRQLASYLAEAGEGTVAGELKIQLGKAVWAAYREPLQGVSAAMPPAAVRTAIDALRAVLGEIPDDVADRNRQANRFLPPLAASVFTIMRERGVDLPYSSRVEHIAAGGVAKYPDIVEMSLDEIAAEFDGLAG